MMYPEASEYYLLPDVGLTHAQTLYNRFIGHPGQYRALWVTTQAVFGAYAMGGPDITTLQNLLSAAEPGTDLILQDTFPVSDQFDVFYGLENESFDVSHDGSELDDEGRWQVSAQAWIVWRMLYISFVLQMERWYDFGNHGGRPPKP